MEMKLNPFELEAVLKWVDGFELSRCRRKLSRDFADGVLLAEIVKSEFPNLVDLHNYNGCSAVLGKIENWNILNRKVLKKLQVHLKPEEIEKLAKAESDCIEEVLFRIMNQIERIKAKNSVDKSPTTEQTSDVMTIKIWKQVGDQLEQIPQQMIRHSVYNELLERYEGEQLKMQVMTEMIEDLQIALKSKSQIIEDLQSQLDKKKNKPKSSLSSLKNSIGSLFWEWSNSVIEIIKKWETFENSKWV